MKHWYQKQIPKGAKAVELQKFPLLEFISHSKIARQHMRDGVMEMMHIIKFAHWASKPKNCPPKGLSQPEAAVEFQRKTDDPDAIVDFVGPVGFEKQVGVLTKQLVIDRTVFEKGQGYEIHDKSKKTHH